MLTQLFVCMRFDTYCLFSYCIMSFLVVSPFRFDLRVFCQHGLYYIHWKVIDQSVNHLFQCVTVLTVIWSCLSPAFSLSPLFAVCPWQSVVMWMWNILSFLASDIDAVMAVEKLPFYIEKFWHFHLPVGISMDDSYQLSIAICVGIEYSILTCYTFTLYMFILLYLQCNERSIHEDRWRFLVCLCSQQC